MEDLTAEMAAELMRRTSERTEYHFDEKENCHPFHHHHLNNISSSNSSTSSNNNSHKTTLIIVDARPFQSLKDATLHPDPPPTTCQGDLSEVTLIGSVRVHYPNLLRKRSKGRMTLENVIVDRNTRSLVSAEATCHLAPIRTDTVVLVYDESSPSSCQLAEDSDAKLALDVLKMHCRDDVRVCFLAGGLVQFHRLHPDLCTPLEGETSDELRGSQEFDSKNSDQAPPTSERFNNNNDINRLVVSSSIRHEDKSDLPCQLLPWLFLGDQSQASSLSAVKRLGITALLNVAAVRVCHESLPVMSAPVPKLRDPPAATATRFPFTPITNSSSPYPFPTNLRTKEVPSGGESVGTPGALREHRFRQDRRTTRRCFYSKQPPGHSPRSLQSSTPDSTSSIQVLNLPISDNLDTDISMWFDLCNSFIERVKAEGGRVLVHCQAGISRSATICLAYLLWSRTFASLNEAFEFVRARRPVVAPNFSFMRQLKEYEAAVQSPFLRPTTLSTPSTTNVFRFDDEIDPHRRGNSPFDIEDRHRGSFLPVGGNRTDDFVRPAGNPHGDEGRSKSRAGSAARRTKDLSVKIKRCFSRRFSRHRKRTKGELVPGKRSKCAGLLSRIFYANDHRYHHHHHHHHHHHRRRHGPRLRDGRRRECPSSLPWMHPVRHSCLVLLRVMRHRIDFNHCHLPRPPRRCRRRRHQLYSSDRQLKRPIPHVMSFDSDDDLYNAVKMIFILAIAVALVFLVEKRHLL